MTDPTIYTEFHPRWLRRPVSTYWWLVKWPYVKFILRELSSVFVAWFVVFLLVMFGMVTRGDAGYRAFVEFATKPVMLAINAVAFIFVVFHAVTWFNVAPQAIVAHVGKKRVPAVLVAGGHYAAWVVVSAGIVWLVLSGRL